MGNVKDIISTFMNEDDLREDHYNGQNSIYRFGAEITEIFGKPVLGNGSFQDEINITKALEILESLPVRPTIVFLTGQDKIQVDWYPKTPVICNSKLEYCLLSLEFARYLDSIQHLEIRVSVGTFQDDPQEISKLTFDASTFDRRDSFYKEIEVIDSRWLRA